MATIVEQKYHHRGPLGILCNPGGGRTSRRLAQIRGLAEGIEGAIYREAGDPEAIYQAISELLAHKVHVLCLLGGDGTVQAALTSLDTLLPPESWPFLAALPGGTTNMTAKDLGSWASVEKGLSALAGNSASPSAPKPTLRQRPVLRIEGGDGARRCGMFFGAGAVAAGIQIWNQRFRREDLPGDGAIGMVVARLLGTVLMGKGEEGGLVQPLSLSTDGGEETRHRGLLVLATTLDRLILKVRPHWGGEDGPLHLTVVEDGARRLMWRLPRLALGRPGKVLTPEAGYLSRNGGVAEMAFTGPYVVDGELFQHRAEDGTLRLTAITGVRWVVP